MIQTFDYRRSLAFIEEDIMNAIRRVLHSGQLILGPETKAFEVEFAQHIATKHAIGVHSGTTAIELALMGLEIGSGDEVITVSNTCTPTVAAIERTGAQAVFVDVSDTDLLLNPDLLESAINPRTRAVVAVHLWGQSVDIKAIKAIIETYGLYLIEDCAQAQGTTYEGQHVGAFGDAGCFSFYPTKNLGAYGDAGAVVTNDSTLAEKLERLRMYGYSRSNYAEHKGMNARISEIQAAILRIKLSHLDEWIARRQMIAGRYRREIVNPHIQHPALYENRVHAYHQYVIRTHNRQHVIDILTKANIGYGIHYPVPIHQMPAYSDDVYRRHPLPVTEKAADEILSIPIHENLTDEEVNIVINTLKELA